MLRREEHQRQSGLPADIFEKLVAALPGFLGVRLVIQFNGTDWLEVGWVAQDKVKVLGIDPVERALPDGFRLSFFYTDDIGHAHLAEHPEVRADRLIENAEKRAFCRGKQSIAQDIGQFNILPR